MLATARDDPSTLRAILADDVDWDVGSLQILGAAGAYHGPDGVMEFFRTWVGAFHDWDYAVGELFTEGDCVVAHIHQWGTGRSSGIRVEQDFWQVWKMRDGKAVRGTNHATREEALAAAAA
jgi:ketosteroid isomerase-like protein